MNNTTAKIGAAVLIAATGLSAAAYTAGRTDGQANGAIFGILFLTLIFTLALIGSTSKDNQP